MKNIFRILIMLNAGMYLIWFFFPYTYSYWVSSESIQVLNYSGFDAHYIAPSYLYWSLAVLTILNTIGLYFFYSLSRKVFVGLIVLDMIFQVNSGLSIYTGIESVVLNLSYILEGIILSIMYSTTVSSRFDCTR
jgi:hypothetical protein